MLVGIVNTNTRVCDGDFQFSRGNIITQINFDTAFESEFQRIGNEIDQNLFETGAVKV